MKQFAAILMVFIMLFLSLRAFAQETLRDKMEMYQAVLRPISQELNQLDIKANMISDQYGNDFKKMDDNALKSYLENRKDYYSTKLALTDQLSKIYYQGYQPQSETIDQELAKATERYKQKCSVISKIADACLVERERLIFQAIYLDTRIETIGAIEAALLNQITTAISEEENSPVENLKL